jgi:predicted nucleic acid-binding protein
MIVDTDVLIDYFRGVRKAKNILADALPFGISSVTQMELMQGARDKEMLSIVERQLRVWKVPVIQVTEAISIRAVQFVREFTLSHSVQVADAIIAATAIEAGEPLLSGNERHFRCIPRLNLVLYKR